jgi:hypothetical protein
MGKRIYPIEIRNEMVDKYLFGEAVSYIAENMHIPYHTTRNIIYGELAQGKAINVSNTLCLKNTVILLMDLLSSLNSVVIT